MGYLSCRPQMGPMLAPWTLLPGIVIVRRQAMTRTNAHILLIEPIGTKFIAILIRIHPFSLKKMNCDKHPSIWCKGQRQAIIWSNAGTLLIRILANFSEILSEIHTFSFKKIHLNMSSGKWWPFCLGLNMKTDLGLLLLIESYGLKLFLSRKPFEWPFTCLVYIWQD